LNNSASYNDLSLVINDLSLIINGHLIEFLSAEERDEFSIFRWVAFVFQEINVAAHGFRLSARPFPDGSCV
jgi:hypothetical protein